MMTAADAWNGAFSSASRMYLAKLVHASSNSLVAFDTASALLDHTSPVCMVEAVSSPSIMVCCVSLICCKTASHKGPKFEDNRVAIPRASLTSSAGRRAGGSSFNKRASRTAAQESCNASALSKPRPSRPSCRRRT